MGEMTQKGEKAKVDCNAYYPRMHILKGNQHSELQQHHEYIGESGAQEKQSKPHDAPSALHDNEVAYGGLHQAVSVVSEEHGAAPCREEARPTRTDQGELRSSGLASGCPDDHLSASHVRSAAVAPSAGGGKEDSEQSDHGREPASHELSTDSSLRAIWELAEEVAHSAARFGRIKIYTVEPFAARRATYVLFPAPALAGVLSEAEIFVAMMKATEPHTLYVAGDHCSYSRVRGARHEQVEGTILYLHRSKARRYQAKVLVQGGEEFVDVNIESLSYTGTCESLEWPLMQPLSRFVKKSAAPTRKSAGPPPKRHAPSPATVAPPRKTRMYAHQVFLVFLALLDTNSLCAGDSCTQNRATLRRALSWKALLH